MSNSTRLSPFACNCRKKRKLQKEKAKIKNAYDLQMKIRGDVADIPQEVELFSLKQLKSNEQMSKFEARPMDANNDDEESGDEAPSHTAIDSANPLLIDDEGVAEADLDANERAKRRADLWFSRVGFRIFVSNCVCRASSTTMRSPTTTRMRMSACSTS